jgi:hypothetical protein
MKNSPLLHLPHVTTKNNDKNLDVFMKRLYSFVTWIILLQASNNAMACSCMYQTLLESWHSSEHVFIGNIDEINVISRGNEAQFDEGEEQGKLSTIKQFKGDEGAVTHLTAAHTPICCICSTKLKQTKYLVFANQTGKMHVGSCSPTKQVEYTPFAEEILEKLQNNTPTIRVVGIYYPRKRQMLVEDELQLVDVNDYSKYHEADKLYVEIEAYKMNNGDLYYVDTHSEIVLSAK